MVGIVPEIIHAPTNIPISINIITGTPIWRTPTAISASILFHDMPQNRIVAQLTKVAERNRTKVVSIRKNNFPAITVNKAMATIDKASLTLTLFSEVFPFATGALNFITLLNIHS